MSYARYVIEACLLSLRFVSKIMSVFMHMVISFLFFSTCGENIKQVFNDMPIHKRGSNNSLKSPFIIWDVKSEFMRFLG